MASESGSAIFDLSLLTQAETQFLVVSDTHFLLPNNAQESEWQSVSEFPARTARALTMAAALPRDFAVHLGDISHEYPETGRADIAQRGALQQFHGLGLAFHQTAGNMDIGDKPDPTSPAQWVTPDTLSDWHQLCGRSWHSFDFGPFHGIVLNTQIMNGPLPEAAEQQAWTEADLANHAGKRLLLFLHMPIYYVHPNEHSLGFYNSLDEPARSWLLSLIDRYGIEMVFSGHTHTMHLNRHGSARMFTAPSTATSRAGLAEAYSVPSPDRGRGDIDKLGFYLVRDSANGPSVHVIRTGRDSPALDSTDPRKIVLTRTSRDLPFGRLGVFASHPLGHANPGPVIWPSIVRQPVRDDFRLLSVPEMGARFLRVPGSDLDTESERERLQVLRGEMVRIEPYWLWSERFDAKQAILVHADAIDAAEIVIPGSTEVPPSLLSQIELLQRSGMPVTLSTALVESSFEGQYHQRTRVGFSGGELAKLDAQLAAVGAEIDRAACRLSATSGIWEQIASIRSMELASIHGIDWHLDFVVENDEENARLVAEALAATATIGSSRLVLGPLTDLDRSMDAANGLLDRLSNPRLPFRVARTLNSLLFRKDGPLTVVSHSRDAGRSTFELLLNGQVFRLVVSAGGSPDLGCLAGMDKGFDLGAGVSFPVAGNDRAAKLLTESAGPVLLTGPAPPAGDR